MQCDLVNPMLLLPEGSDRVASQSNPYLLTVCQF